MGVGRMSEEQQLIDRLVANYKAEQIRVATPDTTQLTPLEKQEVHIAQLENAIAQASKQHFKKQILIAANYVLMLIVGYLSVVALIMMNENP